MSEPFGCDTGRIMAARTPFRPFTRAEGPSGELIEAGYRGPQIELVTRDFDLDMAALDDLNALFGPSPDWKSLNATQKCMIVAELRQMAGDRPQLPIPSTALIGVARRG